MTPTNTTITFVDLYNVYPLNDSYTPTTITLEDLIDVYKIDDISDPDYDEEMEYSRHRHEDWAY